MASRAPTVRQRRLAAALRRLRLHCDLTAEDVAENLAWSQSKISRLETARIGVRPSDVRLLLELYAVDESARGEIMALAHAAQAKPWWADYANDIGDDYAAFIAVEDEADELYSYEPAVVPGLLQTEEYAREVISGWKVVERISERRIDRVTEIRMRRQLVLTRTPQPLNLTAILDESVLMRRIGAKQTMAGQLEKLVEMSRLPNVSIRILPLDAPRGFCLSGGFALVPSTSAYEAEFPAIIYVETAFGQQSDNESLSHSYFLIYEDMLERSLSAESSVECILRIKQELWA